MNKKEIVNFINKYHLNGLTEAVIIDTADNKTICNFVSSEKSVIGSIKLSTNVFENQNLLGIYSTSSFIKLLSALEDDIEISIFDIEDDAKYITLKDNNKKAKFILSHPDIIPKYPKDSKFPPFDIEIELDEEFINNFIKSKNALSDAAIFAFVEDNGKLQIILNYDDNNESLNNISFIVGDTIVELNKPIKFYSDSFKEILIANRQDFDKGFIRLSSHGLMEIKFSSDDYEAIYYQVMVK